MKSLSALAAILAAAAISIANPAHADVRKGVDSWTNGDFAAAVREWRPLADAGDPDAQFNLAQAYKLGRGVPQDLARAEDLFARASDKGHLQAADNYGLLLFQRGERAKALPFIRAAADRGEPRAQYLLGISHFNGENVPKDWVRAYALVSLAHQSGLTQAKVALTQMDQFVAIEQRQQAVALAQELRSQADATRARQFAAQDLGTSAPAPADVVTQPLRTAPRQAHVEPVATARQAAAGATPASAGADFARPAPHPSPPRPQTAPVRTPAPTAVPSTGIWRVQLGAFGVAANADALWNRIKARPELAGHPRINVLAGAVVKLQAGGFATQQAAQTACGSLNAAGIGCLAVKG